MKYKWRQLRFISYIQTLLFFAYLMTLMVHIYMPGYPEPLYAILAFSVYFFIVEIVIFVHGNLFLIFTSSDNIVDLFLVVGMIVYSSI